jgi:uncharacterized phage-associated protein
MSQWLKVAYAIVLVVTLKLALLQNKRLSGGYIMSRSTISAVDIADWFVARANREVKEEFGEGVSNLKLQKILYFAQAASLALDDEELFADEIYAWNFGPVINPVYHNFKDHQSTAIKKPKGEKYLSIKSDTTSFLEDIWQLFGKYSAAKLVEMTHAHAPWKDTYDGSHNKVIPKDLIKSYYKPVFIRN